MKNRDFQNVVSQALEVTLKLNDSTTRTIAERELTGILINAARAQRTHIILKQLFMSKDVTQGIYAKKTLIKSLKGLSSLMQDFSIAKHVYPSILEILLIYPANTNNAVIRNEVKETITKLTECLASTAQSDPLIIHCTISDQNNQTLEEASSCLFSAVISHLLTQLNKCGSNTHAVALALAGIVKGLGQDQNQNPRHFIIPSLIKSLLPLLRMMEVNLQSNNCSTNPNTSIIIENLIGDCLHYYVKTRQEKDDIISTSNLIIEFICTLDAHWVHKICDWKGRKAVLECIAAAMYALINIPTYCNMNPKVVEKVELFMRSARSDKVSLVRRIALKVLQEINEATGQKKLNRSSVLMNRIPLKETQDICFTLFMNSGRSYGNSVHTNQAEISNESDSLKKNFHDELSMSDSKSLTVKFDKKESNQSLDNSNHNLFIDDDDQIIKHLKFENSTKISNINLTPIINTNNSQEFMTQTSHLSICRGMLTEIQPSTTFDKDEFIGECNNLKLKKNVDFEVISNKAIPNFDTVTFEFLHKKIINLEYRVMELEKLSTQFC